MTQPVEKKKQSMADLIPAACFIVGGIVTLVTGRWEKMGVLVEGPHIKIGGAMLFLVGVVLAVRIIQKR